MKKIIKIMVLVILVFFISIMLTHTATAISIDMGNGEYIGLGITDGRIVFDDQATDEIEIMDANVGIGTTGPDAKLDILDTSGPQLRLTYTDETDFTDLQTTINGNLYLAPSNNRVGICTNDPDSELTIYGGDDVDNVAITLDVGSNIWHIGVDDSVDTPYDDPLVIGLGSNLDSYNYMTIEKYGNVGIGTTSPDNKLEILSTSTQLQLTHTDNTDYARFSVDDNGKLTIQSACTSGTTEDIEIRTGSFDDAIFIDDSENTVGIGTTSPSEELEVVGDIKASGDISATDISASADISAMGDVAIGKASANCELDVLGDALISGYLQVDTNTLCVDAGNDFVGIGTTGPSTQLELYKTSGDPELKFVTDSGSDVFTMGIDDSGDSFKIGTTSIDTNTIIAIDSSHNVGIGTESNTIYGKLDIRGDEVRIWDGTASVDYASGEGDLFVEDVLEIDNDMYISNIIYHGGDTDTLLDFNTDNIQIASGNEVLVNIYEGTQDYVKLGDGGDVDINLNDDMFIEGSSGNTAIGTTTVNANSKIYIEQTGNDKAIYAKTNPSSTGTYYGIYSETSGSGEGEQGYGCYARSTHSNYAVGLQGVGLGSGQNIGVYGYASGGTTDYGVYAYASGDSDWAGYFTGRAYISNNVGIGTDSLGTNNRLIVKSGGSTSSYYGLRVQNSGGTDQFVVRSDGNVGIGNNVPGANLVVEGSAIFNEGGADNDFRIEGDTDTTLFKVDASVDNIGIGTTSPTAKLHIKRDSGITQSSELRDFEVSGTSQTIEGDYTNARFNYFDSPSISASTTTRTVTNSATVYIYASPEDSGTAVITNKYALWVDDSDSGSRGDCRFDGEILVGTAVGITSPTARVDVYHTNGYNQLRLRTSYTPDDSNDGNGNLGSIVWDDDFIYVKTNDGWERASLSTFE